MSIMYDPDVTGSIYTPYAICRTCGMKKPAGMMWPFNTTDVLNRTAHCCGNPRYFWERRS